MQGTHSLVGVLLMSPLFITRLVFFQIHITKETYPVTLIILIIWIRLMVFMMLCSISRKTLTTIILLTTLSMGFTQRAVGLRMWWCHGGMMTTCTWYMFQTLPTLPTLPISNFLIVFEVKSDKILTSHLSFLGGQGEEDNFTCSRAFCYHIPFPFVVSTKKSEKFLEPHSASRLYFVIESRERGNFSKHISNYTQKWWFLDESVLIKVFNVAQDIEDLKWLKIFK